MHARAHHKNDPIYAGIRRLRIAKEGEAIQAACTGCHTPRAASLTDPRAERGVSCATCHNTIKVNPEAHGRAALTFDLRGGLFGPHDVTPGNNVAHPTGVASRFIQDGQTLCLACHGLVEGPTGVPICTTGPERAAAAPSDETCVSCHMPKVDKPSGKVSRYPTHRSHIFHGPHRAWYQDDLSHMKGAVELSAVFEGDQLLVTLQNRTGHGFPSGFPGRMAWLALSSTGEPAWKAGPDAAVGAMMNKKYVDAEGKPTLAPWAVKLAADTRLKPDEKRVLRFAVPAHIKAVRATLSMRLLPPPLADKLGLRAELEATVRDLNHVDAVRN